MKKFILFNILLFSVSFSFCQVIDNSEELSRKEKRDLELEQKYKLTKSLVEQRRFVIEANYMIDISGRRDIINPDINFIKIDSIVGVIQLGSDIRVGPNGVGGVTSKGSITNWKMQKNEKRKTFHIMTTVLARRGAYELDIFVNNKGRATAKISGAWSGNFSFEGDLVRLEHSVAFEGDSY